MKDITPENVWRLDGCLIDGKLKNQGLHTRNEYKAMADYANAQRRLLK